MRLPSWLSADHHRTPSEPTLFEISLRELHGAMPATREHLVVLDAGAEALEHVVPQDRGLRRTTFSTDVTAWSPTLLETRGGLHDSLAIQELDRRVLNMCRDPAAPTDREMQRFRSMVTGTRVGAGGDLESGLVGRPLEADPRTRSAFLSRNDVAALLRMGRDAARFWPALAAGHPRIDLDAKALKKVRTALRLELIPMMRRSRPGQFQQRIGLRNKLEGAWAEWEAALEMAWKGDRVSLNRRFVLEPGEEPVEVDLVSDGGRRWTQVKAYEQSFGLKSGSWMDVRRQADRSKRAAALHAVQGRVPEVIFLFRKGLSTEVASALRATGVAVQGGTLEHGAHEREESPWIR